MLRHHFLHAMFGALGVALCCLLSGPALAQSATETISYLNQKLKLKKAKFDYYTLRNDGFILKGAVFEWAYTEFPKMEEGQLSP